MAEEIDYSQYDEATLIEMRDNATDYESRSKIRAALRDLKKKAGLSTGRRPTGSSQYRRPGFQAPRVVTIPNSVTGNVYPTVVKEGVVTKGVDNTTPTIGYLNAQTVKTRKGSKDNPSSSHVTVGSQVPKGSSEESSWWRKSHSSSQSTSPGQTPEPKDRRPSANDTLTEDTFESRKSPTPEPPKEPTPSPEPPKEPTPSPEPLKEPTPSPEPPKEPTPSPSPEPPKEPTPSPSPEPMKEPTPSPEPPKEPTPSPEPIPSPEPPKEPTPSPEPPKEPTPSPEPPKELSPSPEPPKEHTPSPDYDKREEEEEEYYEDEEDEELRQLEEKYPESSSPRKPTTDPLPHAFAVIEPGMEEEKDFRKKLRRTEDTKIDTKAAFPSAKKKAEQVDFRNLLKKSDGPEKKDLKSGSKAQVDFRTNLKAKDSEGTSSPIVPPNIVNTISQEEEPTTVANNDKSESPAADQQTRQPPPPEEDSYEARREARRREREEKRQQEQKAEQSKDDDSTTTSSTAAASEEDSYEARRREREEKRQQEKEQKPEQSKDDDSTTTSSTAAASEEDSYEARREARRKAREDRLKMQAETSSESPKVSYRERKQKEEAKMRADMKANKQKWSEMDQSNGGGSTDKNYTRQKSTSSGAQQLMAWCQHKTRYYENVEIKDFSNSWRDGLALCAILHNFVPDAIPFDDLTPDNPRKNYTVALKAADDAGLDSFFDVEDIIAAGSPDPKSMMTFLATIYTHFK